MNWDLFNEIENMDEINNTGTAGDFSYNTPYAFDGEIDPEEEDKEPKVMTYEQKLEEMIRGAMEAVDDIELIDEANYKDYFRDTSKTQRQKINDSIQEINSTLIKLERMIDQNIKLKNEIGADQSIFMKPTIRRFTKISERLIRIGNKIKGFQ